MTTLSHDIGQLKMPLSEHCNIATLQVFGIQVSTPS